MIVKIFLMAMMVFALLSVKARQLRTAIIYLGVFSLINAVVYIFYGAPDVSLAEAIIGSTLATILYLIAIKKYNPVMVYHIHENNTFSLSNLFGKKRGMLLGGVCIIMCFLTLGTYINTIELTGTPAWDYYVRFFKQDTGAGNAVTAIYLNYRIFDTLFEALLLLVSVIAVIYFSWRGGE
ncbi:putative MnhB-related membrane protein [Caldicoprobacter guelmensis]|uniref:hydrogenase subunit MbhD domain-containing protein n=1 Tax=Caldicoprobacter guelmensis TaxID=1170224 RepID=UPI0019569C13|nr:hydrogenase subunit MbhD domain-containing protein [Caldicoprobacter guelmensis]MBM7581877.1 putative MnhB-related membrane protein [Caldicoprobacter guelmensis]